LSHFDYRRLKKIAVPILVGVILLLVLVLLPELGGCQKRITTLVENRKHYLSTFRGYQISFLLFLSAWLSKEKTDIKNYQMKQFGMQHL